MNVAVLMIKNKCDVDGSFNPVWCKQSASGLTPKYISVTHLINSEVVP